MGKKRLMILLVCLLIIVSLFSIVSSVSATYGEDYYDYSHRAYGEFHYFNGTIVDKEHCRDGHGHSYNNYLIDVGGTTFYLNGFKHGHYGYVGDFNVGDKVTIYGNTIVEDRNMVMLYGFNGKYEGKTYNSTKKFPEIHLGFKKVRLADGYVSGGSSSSTTSTDRYTKSMRILKATITSGEYEEDPTNCTVFIGKGYAGENVKISVLYSYDGKNLNKRKKVPKTVSDSGKIKVPTLNGLKYYPDKAIITIYDSNGNKLDTQTVTLEQNSKPQTFKFFNDPEYASNGAKFVGYAGDGSWANYYKNGHYYTVDGDQID